MGKAGGFSETYIASGCRRLGLFLCACGCLVLLAGCGAKEDSLPKESLLYVDGEPVSEAEMELLEQDAERAVLMKALQRWAEEDGVDGTPFSFDSMLEQMEEENALRARQKAAGEVIYGVTEYSPLQYYRIRMGEYERALKDRIMGEAAEEELEAWYEGHLDNYWQMGEVTAAVTIYSDGRVVDESEVVLSPSNYRTLSEQNEQLAAVMADLPEGGELSFIDDYGMEWRVRCVSRGEGSYEPFADVRGAVAEQYAEEELRLELQKRTEACKVEDLRN